MNENLTSEQIKALYDACELAFVMMYHTDRANDYLGQQLLNALKDAGSEIDVELSNVTPGADLARE